MPDFKRRRPLVTIERIFLCAGEHPSGAKIFVRRGLGAGKRKTRGISIGKANPRELDYIEEHFPEVFRTAYPPPPPVEDAVAGRRKSK